MKDKESKAYFCKRLAEAEKELADFNLAVAKYGMRVWRRDIDGERDVTDEDRKWLEDVVAEYRRMLRDG